MKRLISTILALTLLALTIAACSGGDSTGGGSSGNDPAPGTQTPSENIPAAQNTPEETAFPPIRAMSDSEIVAALIGDRVFEPFAQRSQTRTVNLGYYNCDHMTAAPIARDAGIFNALGLNVSVTGNGRVPEAMAAGHMDLGYVNFYLTLEAKQAGTPLFIAADNHSGGAEYLIASHNITQPIDLLGKRIAVGNDPEDHLYWHEWTYALGITSDITQYDNLVMSSDADKYLAFLMGELDAFSACDPWGSMAEYENTGWVMIRRDTNRENGLGTCCKVVMHNDFAVNYPDLAERMILAHTLAIQFMYLHPYRAAEIFSENYYVPFEVSLMTMYKKLNEEGRTIRWDLNIEYMQNHLDRMKVFDIREDIRYVDPREYVDLTYFDNSGADDFLNFIREQVDPIFPLGMTYEQFREKALELYITAS